MAWPALCLCGHGPELYYRRHHVDLCVEAVHFLSHIYSGLAALRQSSISEDVIDGDSARALPRNNTDEHLTIRADPYIIDLQ